MQNTIRAHNAAPVQTGHYLADLPGSTPVGYEACDTIRNAEEEKGIYRSTELLNQIWVNYVIPVRTSEYIISANFIKGQNCQQH